MPRAACKSKLEMVRIDTRTKKRKSRVETAATAMLVARVTARRSGLKRGVRLATSRPSGCACAVCPRRGKTSGSERGQKGDKWGRVSTSIRRDSGGNR